MPTVQNNQNNTRTQVNEAMRASSHWDDKEGLVKLVTKITKEKIEPYVKFVCGTLLDSDGRIANKIKAEMEKHQIGLNDENNFKNMWNSWARVVVKHTISICRSNKTQTIFSKLKTKHYLMSEFLFEILYSITVCLTIRLLLNRKRSDRTE